MSLAPAMAPVTNQEPPAFPINDLPGELINLIVDFIFQDDHTHSDVVNLLLVNKYFHDNLKKRVHKHLQVLHRPRGDPAPDDEMVPIATDVQLPNFLPSRLVRLTMCHHGPCAHEQHLVKLTSPNIGIQTVYIVPSRVDGDLRCKDSGEAICTPLPILRPRTLAVFNPGTTAEGRANQGIVPDAVNHLAHVILHDGIANMPLTIEGIRWYHRTFSKAVEATVFFQPDDETDQWRYFRWDLHRSRVRAEEIKRLFHTFLSIMLTNEDLQLTVVNVGAFHRSVVRHFCEQGLPTFYEPVLWTTDERQDAVSSWFDRSTARRQSELQTKSILQRVRFITDEEYH